VPIFLDIEALRFVNQRILWYNQFERAEVLSALGCDPMIVICLPDPVPHAEVSIRTRRWREGGRTWIEKEYDTPAGVLRSVVHETDDWCSPQHTYWVQRTLASHQRQEYGLHLFDDWNISRRAEPWVKGPEDVEKLKYVLRLPSGWKLDEWRADAERAMEYARKYDLLTVSRRSIVGDAFQWFCDIPWFCMQLIEAPDFVEAFLKPFHDLAMAQTELVLDLGVDVVQRRGWYEVPTYWGPRGFERFLRPSIQAETELVHQAGRLHAYLLPEGHGHYLDILEKMDLDILWGVDPVMGHVDLSVIKQRLGAQKTILGGVNAEVTLTQGTPEDVERATREAIRTLAPGGGFILSPMAAVWPSTPWDNVEVLVRTALREGRYPIAR